MSTPKYKKSFIEKKLEERACIDLEILAHNLSAKYDLSPETAKILSIGHKYLATTILSSSGKPKVGIGQKQGHMCFDRYISYRIKDEVIALFICLDNGNIEPNVKYQVMGPSKLVPNYKQIKSLRPYLKKNEAIGLLKGGTEFNNFEEASSLFIALIHQLAPSK